LKGPAETSSLWLLLWYFTEAGMFVFGSGLAVIPFLHEVVVTQLGLSERQFLDAVAVAMITPGPVVITSGFIGYLVAGPVGAVIASVGVFLPPFLLVLLLAPHYRRFAQNPQVKAFVQGVTAAATGAIAGAACLLGLAAIGKEVSAALDGLGKGVLPMPSDIPAVLIALVTLGVLFYTKKVPEPVLILTAGVVGLALSP
jgi:chromate transporter